MKPAALDTEPGWTPTRPMAARVMLWFDLLALAIGSAQVLVGEATQHTVFALAALIWLVVSAVLVRTLPSLRPRVWVRCALDTLALLVFASGFAAATGGVHSSLLTLFLLPLTAAAIALGRWMYALVAIATIAAVTLLGALTPEVQVRSSEFAVLLISALAPALIATAAIAMLMEQMQGAERHIEDLRSVDSLTGLLNRHTFEQLHARHHRKAERGAQPYSLLTISVANTGEVSAFAGRDGGNQLVAAVAAAISRSIRTADLAARFEGDELIVLLVDTDPQRAAQVAQRIRSTVYAGTISLGNRLVRATIHVGIATFPRDGHEAVELLALAEQRMRQERETQKSSALG